MPDPAVVLRAAADLAEQRARAASGQKRRWLAEWFVERIRSQADAEHIAAADPAFMLKRAKEWRRAAEIYIGAGMIYAKLRPLRMVIEEIALPSALAYLRQDQP